VVSAAQAQGVAAWVAGQVEAGPKRVVVEPLGIQFDGDSLSLR